MINIFAYALNAIRAAFIFLLSATMVGSLVPAGRDYTFGIECKAERYEARARILASSIEITHYNKFIPMLHNNSSNHFTPSGCWDAAALLTMYTQLARLDGRNRNNPFVREADRVLYMLEFYGRRELFNGFSIATGEWSMFRNNIDDSVPENHVYYDDNMWIGRDLVALYNLTGNERYLNHAIAIADMLIAEGWDYLDEDMFTVHFGRAPGGPLGGWYWRDDKVSLHVCSNGPAIQYFVMLANAIGLEDERAQAYIDYAKMSYRFLRYLERPNGVFWDLMNFHKDEGNKITGIRGPAGASWTYNSGTPISSAIELYKLTGEQHYLDDAIRWGAGAHAYFPRESTVPGVKTFLDLPWFREILLMGYMDLYAYDKENALGYIQAMETAINYGYEHHRLNGVFGYNKNHIPRDWVNGFRDDEQKQSGAALEQIPNAGIYAALSMFYADLK